MVGLEAVAHWLAALAVSPVLELQPFLAELPWFWDLGWSAGVHPFIGAEWAEAEYSYPRVLAR